MPSIAEDPAAAASKSHAPTSRRSTRLPRLAQLALLQDGLLEDGRKPDITPTARAQVARAWKELETLRQELLGKGKPRPVVAKNDPELKARRARRPVGPITAA